MRNLRKTHQGRSGDGHSPGPELPGTFIFIYRAVPRALMLAAVADRPFSVVTIVQYSHGGMSALMDTLAFVLTWAEVGIVSF